MKRLKKGKRIFISIAVIAAVIFTGITGGRQCQKVQREKILNAPYTPLTKAEKAEDMEYLYQVIQENYPYLEVNKRLNGVDWEAQKEEYIRRVKETESDIGFRGVLEDIVGKLNNGHTQILTSKEQVEGYRYLYYRMKQQKAWQGMLYDILDNPMVLRRYQVEDQIPQETAGEGRMNKESGNDVISADDNVTARNIIEGKVGYVQIKQMLNPWNMDKDKEILLSYFEEVSDYPVLIIDIRGNGGGDTSYWQDFLVPYLTNKPRCVTQYGFYKDGKVDDAVLKAKGLPRFKRNKISDLNLAELPKLPPEVPDSFSYYVQWKTNLKPVEEGISYEGQIYLLVDEGVYSASEAFAAFSKDSGFACLVGERTGGDGIGEDPVFAVLPNSGYVLRFSLEMGTSQDGTCDEEYKTIPDYIVNAEIQEDYQEDACIAKVLELEEDHIN